MNTIECAEVICRRKLASRVLVPGECLPSIRRFAAMMGVSPSTVVEAYDRLAAEGVIRSRPGSGFYVVGASPSLDLRVPEPRHAREIDPFWVSRQSLDAEPEVLKPGCGWLPPDWMPQAAMRRALRQLARGPDAILTDYGSSLIDRTDRVLALMDGFMPECRWLDDIGTLTYLHSTISTNRHRVRVPEVPMYLDALLADQPLTGGPPRCSRWRGLPIAMNWPGRRTGSWRS